MTDAVDPKADEVELAEYVLSKIGKKNLLLCDDGFHQWNKPVWRPYSDDAWRYEVQSRLKAADGLKLSASKISSVASIARTDTYRPGFEWPHDDGDAVACTNGVVRWDGKSWQLSDHDREEYRTSTIPVAWNPQATAPRFKQFLIEVFEGDPDITEKCLAVLEILGYTLMRHTRHEKFVILVGTGANGKSVLMAVLEALCGPENIAAVAPDQLGRPFQRAELHGKLANVITELKQGEQIADAALKSIVSGEPCTVERKYGHPYTMRPYATQIYGTNHMPHTRDFSEALFRRALVIPFNNRFKGSNADRNLIKKLLDELPGILLMALNAYGQALINGFTEPESCIEAKENWRMEADQVARYLQERIATDPGGWVLVQAVYNDYREWADDAGIYRKVGKHEFSERLDKLNIVKTRKTPGMAFDDVMISK